MITLARRWAAHNDVPLDGILQVGDMGAFPDHDRLDASTRRFARTDPDELGFRDFLSETADARTLLAPADTPPVAFCRGNHEDFDYLSRFSTPATLDPYGKLWFVPDGATLAFDAIRIAAFGAAAPLAPPAQRGARARKVRRKAARAEHKLTMGPRFRIEDLDRMRRRDLGRVDILLTHAGPAHPSWRGGSRLLLHLARSIRPRVHLFGHHHQVVGPVSTPEGLLVGLEHLAFLKDGMLRPGSWGVLTLCEASVGFEWASPEAQPWVADVTRWTWREGAP